VCEFRPGDEVFGLCRGALAEYACLTVGAIERKPTNVTFEQAAAVPTSATTALQGLCDVGGLEVGQRVLVTGAAGGVGSYAVQLAKLFGAEVTGVCSTRKVAFVRSLGADHVIDYERDDIVESKHRFDLIVDIAGNRKLADLREALTRSGTLVIVGGEEGGRLLGGVDRQLRAAVLSRFVDQELRAFIAKPSVEDLRLVRGLIAGEQLVPAVDRTYPLTEAPQALRYLEANRAQGKVVVTV
jgi:NADPH:quinone reductase-like Zn-dependent oxidoreductase